MSAIARWNAFLTQIDGRHRTVREEAEGSARAFIAQVAGGGDVQPLSHELMALRRRLQELEAMVTDTWHAKVEDAIFSEGGTVADRDREWAKGERLRHALDDAREELEPRLLAELARQRYAYAQQAHRPIACSACGQTLETPLSYRRLELACACGATTMFQPNELLMSVGSIAAHAVAQEAVVAEWRTMRAAERAMHAHRPPYPLAAIQGYERSQIEYWFRYLEMRSRFEPELARDPQMEVRSRMDQWYVMHAEHEENWVKAGRPRMI